MSQALAQSCNPRWPAEPRPRKAGSSPMRRLSLANSSSAQVSVKHIPIGRSHQGTPKRDPPVNRRPNALSGPPLPLAARTPAQAGALTTKSLGSNCVPGRIQLTILPRARSRLGKPRGLWQQPGVPRPPARPRQPLSGPPSLPAPPAQLKEAPTAHLCTGSSSST